MTCSPTKTSPFKMKPDSVSESWLVFDIETDGLYDQVSTTYCIVIYDIGLQQTFTFGPDCIADALDRLAAADVLIGHNIIFYDIPVLHKLYGLELNARIIDTLICTRLIWPKELLYDLDTEQYPQVPKKNRGTASLKAWGWRLADHKIELDLSGSLRRKRRRDSPQDPHTLGAVAMAPMIHGHSYCRVFPDLVAERLAPR